MNCPQRAQVARSPVASRQSPVASRQSQSQIASCRLQVARSRVIGKTKRFWARGGSVGGFGQET